MAGVGSGSIDVGEQTSVRSSGQPVERIGGHLGPQTRPHDAGETEPPRVSGAMTQQCGDGGRGNQSAPQKLVHLVGCRDRNARPKPWVRPNPTKR